MESFRTGKLAASLAVAGCLAVGSQARANSLQTFFGQDFVNESSTAARPNADQAQSDFLSNLSSFTTQDFENATQGSFSSLPVQLGSDTATLSGNQTSIEDSPILGTFATSGNQYVDADGGGSFTVAFNSPQAAFGFFGTDIGDANGRLSLTFSDGTDQTVDVPHTINAADGSVLYFGVIATQQSDNFKSVTFKSTAGGDDVFGLDDLTIGTVGQVNPPPPPSSVPTPAAFGAGLALFGGLLARRRHMPRD